MSWAPGINPKQNILGQPDRGLVGVDGVIQRSQIDGLTFTLKHIPRSFVGI